MAKQLSDFAVRLERLPLAAVTEAAARFDVIAREAAASVVGNGGKMRLHGKGNSRRPVQLSTRSKITGGGDRASFEAKGTPKGLWVWVEDGTKPHLVGIERSYLKAESYDRPVEGPIAHPGSRGPRAWTQAVNMMRAEYPAIIARNLKG